MDAASDPPAGCVCPVIVGPTAVGKTGLVLELAASLPIEVISLDSRQIYRGLRIGTAQPSSVEQAACRHHLVDFVAPEDAYSAQRFRTDFIDCWRAITGRGRLPVLVGGAGLYLRAVTTGFLALPEGSQERLPDIRRAVLDLDDDALDRELRRIDPESADRLHPHDRYRRRRALEIHRLTGRTFTALAAAQPPDPALGLEFPLIVLERDVEDLDRRIAARTGAMLAAGWLEETGELLQTHAADCRGLRSIGYAEIVRHLAGDLAAEDLAPAIVRVTRQYAKRQRTWFRPLERTASGAPEDPRLRDRVLSTVSDAARRLASA